MVNAILHYLNRNGFQWLLTPIIFLGYLKNGKHIRSVSYVKELGIWVLHVGNYYFVSRGPGWAYDLDFLEHEYQKYSGFCYRPKAGDVVIDLGAGIGEETFLFSKWVGSGGKVFSIEANVTTFSSLSHLIAINNLKNVKTDLLAISNVCGKVFIEDNDDLFLQNTIVEDLSDLGQATEVEACTMDSYFERNAIDQ